MDNLAGKDKDTCEFYHDGVEGPVCACGSEVSSESFCTKEYSLRCPYANRERERLKKSVEGGDSARGQEKGE